MAFDNLDDFLKTDVLNFSKKNPNHTSNPKSRHIEC